MIAMPDVTRRPTRRRAVCLGAVLVTVAVQVAAVQPAPTLDDARHLFYNAQYQASAEMALAFQTEDPDDELAREELRATAVLFQLRALLEPPPGKESGGQQALERCAGCSALLAAFNASTTHGQLLARTRLNAKPADETALFFLGKFDLNYLWLQLGLLHRRTGWNEYWEARHALDAVLKANPQHVRARVARAWIDYIVHTKMPWGARWILGGGDKKKALVVLHQAAANDTDFFAHAEAEFSLWDILVRERRFVEAAAVAERLATTFPGNREVATFLQAKRR
jgi:hypothetical protein